MLERYGAIARLIYPLRAALYAGVVSGVGFFAYALFASPVEAQETWMFLPMVVVLWCVCLAMFAHGFRGEFPRSGPDDGWFRRLRIGFVRMCWHALALAVIAFGGATVWLTARAVIMFGH